jgi:Flp pilus assembly protein TadG
MRPSMRLRTHRRRAAVVVETALVLNVMLLVILGVFEYGRIVMLRQLLQNAAREGARMAVVGTASTPDTTTTQIQTAVTSFLAGQSISGVSIQVYQANPTTGENIGVWDQTPYGGAIAVKITGSYIPSVPSTFGIIPNPVPLSVVSMMRSEAN